MAHVSQPLTAYDYHGKEGIAMKETRHTFKPRYDKGLWPVLIGVLLLPLVRAGLLRQASE